MCLLFSTFTIPLTLPCSALYGKELSMHVRFPAFSPLVAKSTFVVFRHHAQQATSEKKRISTVNRRPRAYTTNAQPRSALSPLSYYYSHLPPLLPNDVPPLSKNQPTNSRETVRVPTHPLGITLTIPQEPSLPPPLPPALNRLHSAILSLHSVLQ